MKSLITYTRVQSTTQKGAISRKLFGYTDRSNHGRYEYDRPGLLTSYGVRRIRRGVVEVDTSNEQAVISLLRRHGFSVSSWKVQ